jgi:D-serine deaminase-like pyridoxal phosphate-dependent protein
MQAQRGEISVLDPDLAEFQEILTPALVVDADVLSRNISDMAATAKARKIDLRPHAKTHKSLEIARLQLDAGAVGISCATVAEIEAFARAGIHGLLLTSPVADKAKLGRLTNVARRTDLSIVVDHTDQISALAGFVSDNVRPIRALIDIDVGQRRTGVCDVQSTIELAKLISTKAWLRFGGIQGFAGHIQHIADAAQRESGAVGVSGILNDHLQGLRSANIDADVVTGSGTGANSFDSSGPYTELQVGSYVFMDADYGALKQKDGGALPYSPSLFVLATVTSINRRGEFTVDAGVKALAFNGPMPNRILGAPEGSAYRFGGDEHGMITMPEGCTAPKLGSRVLILTTHCDPTVNLYSTYHVIGANHQVEKWSVLARYGS